MNRLYYSLGLLFLILGSSSQAQNKSNRGKEFWLGYGNNVLFTATDMFGNNYQNHVLYLSAEEPAIVRITINNTNFDTTVKIPANTVDFSVLIPKSGINDARILEEGLFTKGIHIESDVPIVAYSHQYAKWSSAGTMLIPVETYGYSYYSLNYEQVVNYSNSYSWFYVIAAEDGTRVEISPSDTTMKDWLPGKTYTVDLKKGELYNVFGKSVTNGTGKDMTGSKIISVSGLDGKCHPIAVFCGSSRATICAGNGGEVLQQQMFPAWAWGNKYVVYHTVNNTGGNLKIPFPNFYRVAVRDPNTIVKRNGVALTGLINNFYYEFKSSSGDVIESDQPIMVAQYTVNSNECTGTFEYPNGDPEMIYLSPIEQGIKNVYFYSQKKDFIDMNFVNVIVPLKGLNSLLIDGSSVGINEYVIHPEAPDYAVVCRRFLGAAKQHHLECDSAFIATAYGAGIWESYGYNAGTYVKNLNSSYSYKNSLNSISATDSFTCPKTPIRFKLKLSSKVSNINWGFSKVASLNATDTSLTNPIPSDSEIVYGRKYYLYELNQEYQFNSTGNFQIPVEFTSTYFDNCGNMERMYVDVTVKTGPSNSFSWTGVPCESQTMDFKGVYQNNGYQIKTHLWDLPDGSTSNTANTKFKFSAAGKWDLRYRVIAENGCTADTTIQVEIFAKPTAGFRLANEACSNRNLIFEDTSSSTAGNLSKWHWEFGDGSIVDTAKKALLPHVYALPGSYEVKLSSSSSLGCISDTLKRFIEVNPTPQSKFTLLKNVCLGEKAEFSDVSTISNGQIIQRYWDMGDLQKFTRTDAQPFQYNYANANSYDVKLAVLSERNCMSDTFKLSLQIFPKPIVSFNFKGIACEDSLFVFSSSISVNSGVQAQWYWDFGDGQVYTSTSTSVSTHGYKKSASSILIKHAYQLLNGCKSDTVNLTISVVNSNPQADFSITADNYCENSVLQFGSNTVNSPETWEWDFGNTQSKQVPPFVKSFSTAGTYKIRLIRRSSEGCGSIPVQQTVTIHPLPVITAGPDKVLSLGKSVKLDANIALPGNYSFQWTPTLYLDNPTLLNPTSTPLQAIIYKIKAIDNITKCVATDEVKISPITKLSIPNAFTPNGDGKNDTWNIRGLELYPVNRVQIYNRWGQLIYESSNYSGQPWDGTIRGKAQPNGGYAYLIDLGNNLPPLSGTILILR